MTLVSKLNKENENMWLMIGQAAETMLQPDKALYAYENALRHNRYCVKALTQTASIFTSKDQFAKAVEFYQRAASLENSNANIWGSLGYCFLMMDDLQKAFAAYQQALKLTTAQTGQDKDPDLWYGIGILYERCAHYADAVEAFTSVLKTDPNFDKANEIYFRLGIIYKQQGSYQSSLECFGYILANPPPPLTEADIWFQIGHVYELKKCFPDAKRSYERVLDHCKDHSKVLQQLGWLYHNNEEFCDQEAAIQYLKRSIQADPDDGQTWYLLGRCFMAQQKYRLAYDAYQQAVFRDGRNPTFWCSIGLLYYRIGQTRDALHAYSRAIKLDPGLSEVWYDLGTLYDSNGQTADAIDAYQRASELDPENQHIRQKLESLRARLASGDVSAAPQQQQQQQQQQQRNGNIEHLESISSIERDPAAHNGQYGAGRQGGGHPPGGAQSLQSPAAPSPASVSQPGAARSTIHTMHPGGAVGHPAHYPPSDAAARRDGDHQHHSAFQRAPHQYPSHGAPSKGYPLAYSTHTPQQQHQQHMAPQLQNQQTGNAGEPLDTETQKLETAHVPPIRNLQVESSQKKRSIPTPNASEPLKRQRLDGSAAGNGGGPVAPATTVDDDDDDDDDEMVIKED